MASFVVAFSGAMMPGPLLTVTVTQTARRGFIGSVLIVIGHSLLELFFVIGLVFGLGSILEKKWVMGAVALLGGIMLLWMGWGMIRDARRGVLDLDMSAETGVSGLSDDLCESSLRANGGLVVTGALVSLSNPYWLLWWSTIGIAGMTYFRMLISNPVLAIGVFYVGHIMGDIVWYLAVGGAVVSGRKLLSSKAYTWIVQVCGVFLVFLGLSFIQLLLTGKLWAIKMSMAWMKH